MSLITPHKRILPHAYVGGHKAWDELDEEEKRSIITLLQLS